MKKTRLIINADDFGRDRLITDAIIDCHIAGTVTSTTLMANMPAAEYASERATNFPMLGVGVHLVLTSGSPVLPPEEVPQLVDNTGQFKDSHEQPKNLIWPGSVQKQVEKEFIAQVERLIDLGIRPTHLDSHHHIARMPAARQAMVKTAKKFGIRTVRTEVHYYWLPRHYRYGQMVRCVVKNIQRLHRIGPHFVNHWLLRYKDKLLTPDRNLGYQMLLAKICDPKKLFLTALDNLPCGTTEFIFHPVYSEQDGQTSGNSSRLANFDATLLQDSEVVEKIKKADIELISFRDL